MEFLKLERKDYKKVSREFRNTFIGGRLYLIFDWFCSLAVLNFFGISIIGISDTVTETENTVSSTVLNSISNVSFWLLIILSVFSYYKYLKYLEKYADSKKKD